MSQLRVLVADDDPMFRRLIERHVGGWGYEVLCAEDGEQAWEMLRHDAAPRIAILDWLMPGLDGAEVCRRLKGDPALPYVYTIMLTSRDDKQDMISGLEAGADEYLTKPVDTAVLRSRLTVAGRIVQAVPPREWSKPQLPDYEVQRLIGKGAAATVWEAIQLRTGKRVALKIIRLDLVTDETKQRFEREVRIIRELHHPYIARLLDSRLDDRVWYYAMDFVDGCDLGRWTKQAQPTDAALLSVMAKVCAAVGYAHQHGVVHRDLKLRNILVTNDNRPMVVDFGVAKSLALSDPDRSGTRTLEGSAVGTPMFMAPEQAGGDVDRTGPCSDVYALGIILYICLTRHHPHKLDRATDWKVMRSIVEGDPRPIRQFRPDLDPRLAQIVMKALAKKPDDRYTDAGQFGAQLHHFLGRNDAAPQD